MSSPPVALRWVCANPAYRDVRLVRARKTPVGVLVLAASSFLVLLAQPAGAQFPIRQMPGGNAQGVGNREWGVGKFATDSPHSVPTRRDNPQSIGPPLPAVARIVVPEKDGVSFGSGTLVDVREQFGLVVTNWHVVRDAAGQISVEFPDGFKSPAQVVRTDKDWDLAALTIYRPRVTPMSVTAVAPQPGDELTIAGYGSGQWRMAQGRCTQYLAPGVEFPHELVELAAEARQGDSGGPILNQRGELAGVLFGSGPGYTSGSYGGRVLKFLSTVVPGGALASEGTSPSSPPPERTLASADPGPAITANPEAGFSDMSGETDSRIAMTPALQPSRDPLLTPPPRRESADRFGPRTAEVEEEPVDPRVAVSPSKVDFNASTFASPVSTFPLRANVPGNSGDEEIDDVAAMPTDQLMAAIWRQVGGVTVFDQAKTVLAGIGILAIVVVYFRLGGQKEREPEED